MILQKTRRILCGFCNLDFCSLVSGADCVSVDIKCMCFYWEKAILHKWPLLESQNISAFFILCLVQALNLQFQPPRSWTSPRRIWTLCWVKALSNRRHLQPSAGAALRQVEDGDKVRWRDCGRTWKVSILTSHLIERWRVGKTYKLCVIFLLVSTEHSRVF